jgi:hypothetical protein
MDPGTGLTVLGAALGSKELVVKILGPTADYLGAGLKDWTERATMNVQRVFYQAAKKLGNRIGSEIGRDDRGAAHVALIGRLSAYQIRSHYFFYSIIRHLYGGKSPPLSHSKTLP